MPARVAGRADFTAIAAGPTHRCGIAARAAYCRRANDVGQLGVGAFPVPLLAPSEPVTTPRARGRRARPHPLPERFI